MISESSLNEALACRARSEAFMPTADVELVVSSIPIQFDHVQIWRIKQSSMHRQNFEGCQLLIVVMYTPSQKHRS